MGLLKRILGRERQGTPPALREPPRSAMGCDVCGASFDPAAGYYLPTAAVVTAESYWVRFFRDIKATGSLLGQDAADLLSTLEHAVPQFAGQSSAWAVCEECSELFVFDRARARAYAIENRQPDDCRKVDPSGCTLFAALGWQEVFGRWPSNVQQATVMDTCDLCEKSMYVGEATFKSSPARLQDMRINGLTDSGAARRVRTDADGTQNVLFCHPCMARLLARAHRTGYRYEPPDGATPV